MTGFATIAHEGQSYRIIEHSPSLSKAQLNAIFENSLPVTNRQLAKYVGSQSVKWAPLENDTIAVVLSKAIAENFNGKRKISYKSSVILLNSSEAIETLRSGAENLLKLLDPNLPIVVDQENVTPLIPWTTRLRLMLGWRVLIKYPYVNAEQWRSVEIMMLNFMKDLPLRWLQTKSFVTFTLDEADPSDLSLIPLLTEHDSAKGIA